MSQFTLPDTLANWPYPRHLNPHYDVVASESSRWTESFSAFDSKAQNSFNRCDFGRLALLAFPLHDKARARTGADLMNLFFIIDEHSDVEDEHVVRQMADMIMDALRNPHKPRPSGEWVGGEATRQFWELAIQTATPTAQRRFVETFSQYMDAVVQQAEDRTNNHIRTFESYLEVRRDTIGAKPSFAILELEMDLPDEVFNHPTLENLRMWVIDMLCIGNDICSYNIEQARGDDLHNMVTVVMHQNDTDVNGAMTWIGEFHDRLAKSFLLTKDRLPSWGEPIDSQVARYVHGLGNWVRANDQWSFESQRYFGTKGLDILNHRVVKMLPKVKPTAGIAITIPSAEQVTPSIPLTHIPFPMYSVMSRNAPYGVIRLDKLFRSISAIASPAVPVALTGLLVIYMTLTLSLMYRTHDSPWVPTSNCPASCTANHAL